MTQPPVDLAVIGGGIAGLAAAWSAQRAGLTVQLFETARQVGGKVRSEQRDGYLIEWGPNSFLGSHDALWQLIEQTGLGPQVVRGKPPGARYIYRHRKARQLPSGPGSLLTGDYMSLGGKLRMLAEPFMLGDAQEGETVLAFASRRLGAEAAQYLVTPFVSGIYAGDPDRLGARDAFPRLWQWEHEAGSVALGALLGVSTRQSADATQVARARGLYSLREGLGSLPLAIAAALPAGSVHTRRQVTALEPAVDGGYQLRHTSTKDPSDSALLHAKRVVVATPVRAAAGLLHALPLVGEALAKVEVCRVAVVHFGGPDPEGCAPQGFGILNPPGEGLRTLGILFPSAVFDGRTPHGHWLHTAFLGGVRDPDAVDLPDETLLSLARRAQQQAFGHLWPGRELPCSFHAVVRWRDAIPQYHVGHRDLMAGAVRALEAAWPGVTLAGNHVAGISMQDAARSGMAAVDRLTEAP